MHLHSLAAGIGGALCLAACAAGAAERPSLEQLRFELERTQALVLAQAQRAAYPEYFRRAYARYPNLPAGALEAIAYAETGWNHVRPEAVQDAHELHMPRSYGVMGLYHGGGFADQVGDGARLIGRSAQQVIDDPQSNILAAAALLDRALAASQGGARSRALARSEDLAPALARYAGYGASDRGLAAYARQNFAYAVLDTLQRGVDAQGVRIAPQPLRLERAFAPEQLRTLRAPALRIDTGDGSVRVDEAFARELSADVRATPAGDVSVKAVDFGEALWNPASPSNYSTAGNAMSAVILHTMEGSYAGSIAWFQNPSAQVSAHYLIRKSDGQITQMVREYHQAWHAKYHNYYTVGIEHDGRAGDAANWSSAMLNASARLTKSLCARRGIDCRTAWNGPGYDTWHLVPDSVRIKGHGMLSQNENRYDPGKYFPWTSYYTLLNGGGTPTPGKYWVDTFADATGYKWPSTLTPLGTLYKGTNYVYCKAWGQEVRVGDSYNHYWLKTDLDVGPAGAWVSAYYLSRWGNDEARDNSGAVIPDC